MNRKAFINILENVFPPSVNQAMKSDLLGKSIQTFNADADATPTLNFNEYSAINLVTGSVNITGLDAELAELENGEEILLVITQGATARTLVWGTGWIFAAGTGPTITASANAIDVFKGVVVGGSIVLSVVAQNVS